MGLFDKIKKSLFGDNEEEEKNKKSEEESQDKEAQDDDQADSDSEKPSESEQEEKNSQLNESDADSQSDISAKSSTANKAEEENGQKLVAVETENQSQDNDTASSDVTAKSEADEAEEETDQSDSQTELYEKGLEKTNQGFGARLNKFFAQFRTVDEDFFDDLEELLIESDVGYETAEQLTTALRDEAKLQKAKSRDDLKKVIVEKLVELYDQNGDAANEKLSSHDDGKTNIYLFVGVNGAGKTTTIGKLAKRFKDEGKSVLLAAADTFRAGAVEQLVEWGKRVGVPVVTGKEQADPASVVFDATTKAIAEHADYLLVDTAGRLQNKKNLMSELEKIERTIKKQAPDEPTETLLVLDGSTGQNALLQAKDFDKTTKLTGLVLTKLDGSSKGGVVLAIRNEMKLPVKLVGLGEKASDLADFDAADYAVGLFHDLV
ncbi:signal recognition particle-docking protein FtsY [Lactobacillus sp. B4026]|uniref:signal recognition particle-docking protein FtsY n=1 Tax=Lactobacillus sp. B4026 TaxID=2818035 RepID=UPI00226B03D9|nr:signal recognition particle-docking protein FtsY [Lactobacillus sp. B4026]MCX8736103.1 signal recognition particle-docking protein FtsY [Lactobacillus sp. B4026]